MSKPIVYDPNEDIEERCQLYVGRSKITGLYTHGVLDWFRFNREWIETIAQSDEDIITQLHIFDKAKCPWTNDLNEADAWDKYWISKYQRYLPGIYWRKVSLKTEPLK